MNSPLNPVPRPGDSRSVILALTALGALLLIYGAEVTITSRALSATWNEPYHIFAGYSYWLRADYGINPEHPPLAKLVATIPLLPMTLKSPNAGRDDSKPVANMLGRNFVYGNNPQTILFRTRLAEAVLGLLLVALIFEAGYRMFGAGVSVFAALLAVFEPNLLAHTSLVTTDVAFSLFFLASVYAFWRLARKPTTVHLLGCGVMTGLALASKHSALILIPTLALLAVFEFVGAARSALHDETDPRANWKAHLRFWMGRLLVIYALAILVLWGFYGFQYQARPDGLPLWQNLDAYAALLKGHLAPWALIHAARYKLLPQSYLFGLIDVMMVTAGPRMSYLFGHLYPHALWYYFPVAFVIKSTVGFLAILVLALAAIRRWAGEQYRQAVYLLLPPTIFMGAALTAGTNLGIRHVLPVYPFLILAAAAGAWELARKARAWKIAIAALVLMHCESSLRTLPDYLAYSNELFGGTNHTYQTLSESNVDWGQGLLEARQYLAQRKITECWFAYLGTADVPAYRLPCRMLPNPFLQAQDAIPPDTFRGTVLVSATNLAGPYFGGGVLNPYAGFMHVKPVANIGGSILVYEGESDLRPAAAVAHMVRAWEYFRARYPEQAIQEALKAGERAPHHPGPPYIVGYVLAQQKRTEAARAQFEESLRLARQQPSEFQAQWVRPNQQQLARLPR